MPLTQPARQFALEQIANITGLAPERFDAGDALLETVFHELSRTPEIEGRRRDQWGNWDFSFGDSNRRGELYVPWLDHRILQWRDRMLAANPGAAVEPMWPEGKSFALCLTHDVDLVSKNPSFGRSATVAIREAKALATHFRDAEIAAMSTRGFMVAAYQMATLRGMRRKPERSYSDWLKLEDKYGFRSTFFYFPERVSPRHPYDCHYGYDDAVLFDGGLRTVREMAVAMKQGGWEIGLHGSFHSALQPGLLADQKRQIEGVSQAPVVSTRQHWLHYDAERTPVLQAEAGLQVDSTQGFNRNIGFRAGTAFPYPCWDHARGESLPVLEIPQHIMDGALFTSNALEYDHQLAVRHCVDLMDQVSSVGGCLTLSWHPNVIDNATYWGVYEDVLAEAARRQAWGCTAGQLAEWWCTRAERIRSLRGTAANG